MYIGEEEKKYGHYLCLETFLGEIRGRKGNNVERKRKEELYRSRNTHNRTIHQKIKSLESKQFRRILKHLEYTKAIHNHILVDEQRVSKVVGGWRILILFLALRNGKLLHFPVPQQNNMKND